MAALDDFLEDYDEVSSLVARGRYQDFAALVRRWFQTFQEAPEPIRDRVDWLEGKFSWERVEKEVLGEAGTMGPSNLTWPENREERLAAQLNLFRRFAAGTTEGHNFAFEYFRTGSSNINEILHSMTDALFVPFVSELRRYLVRNGMSPVERNEGVPASDRIVSLDHNSKGYVDLVGTIDNLDATVIASNSLNEGSKERASAELSAVRVLLKPATIRRAAVSFVAGVLGWMAVQFAEAAFAPIVQAALALLRVMFPWLPA